MARAAFTLTVENGFPRGGIAGSCATALSGDRERQSQHGDPHGRPHRRNHSDIFVHRS
jgi:hypothetical protein